MKCAGGEEGDKREIKEKIQRKVDTEMAEFVREVASLYTKSASLDDEGIKLTITPETEWDGVGGLKGAGTGGIGGGTLGAVLGGLSGLVIGGFWWSNCCSYSCRWSEDRWSSGDNNRDVDRKRPWPGHYKKRKNIELHNG